MEYCRRDPVVYILRINYFERIAVDDCSDAQVHLQEELLYLHPTIEEGEPTEDPWVTGTCVLWLPKARTLRKLTVRLM